ncbi:arsenate reductase (glutaredoxin) [Jeongeupia sp. USM3]|uniref:arsenate reductase (glutaredoxin) n=1 Tax=Jeongeupia sp. USM3 TaxID=1906741 RepID=UPI00089E0246|nr:arsenate reductase (glutaredoxin) [Jeongeupia sp. USM3]AOY00960.1 arsenate reductase (glutaredoxin) [Jeongeupia sp. USM3]
MITIYHNPRCSKSRGVEAEVIEYLTAPPDVATLRHLLSLLRLSPRELMRRKEAEYAELGLDDPALDDAALLAAMVAHPRLIERPIVVADNARAALGRPPEAVLALLD